MLGWGERFFAQHGGKTVFLARWTAGLRIFGAWIAGMTHMPWRTFFLWNAAGGITWVTATVMAGYLFSGSVEAHRGPVRHGGQDRGDRRARRRPALRPARAAPPPDAARKAEMAAAGDDGTIV